MANGYYQNFTLTDIFCNEKLKNKIPFITYKEKELESGRLSQRTSIKTVNRQVFDTATTAARPFYKPLITNRNGDTMIISGEMIGDQDDAVDAVYNALYAKRLLLLWTANNAEMVRSALKEAQKNKRNNGINSKLYLRAQSMQQIEGMNNKELQALLTNVMENIIYGDDFPATQKKFKVEEFLTDSPLNYEQRKLRWKYRVGDV